MSGVAVLKIGGSILSGPRAYVQAAGVIAERLARHPEERIVAVVSAAKGVTDALLSEARGIVDEPDAGCLDLLWSTGEIRSVALLTLQLQALGIRSTSASVHQTGLIQAGNHRGARTQLHTLRLRALLADHEVVVVPGFFACASGDRIVSLGRGGSDLTAVLLAAGLGATKCELFKDVDGYFTADPRCYADARPLSALTYPRALEMAEDGCALVQRAALEAAMTHRLELEVRRFGGAAGTVIK